MISYPRLGTAAALGEISAMIAASDTAALTARGATTHLAQEWYPTARRRAEEDELRALAAAVRQTAFDFGFPARLSRSRVTAFDQALIPQLDLNLTPVPSDAAEEGMWNFITLVLLPDVAAWRFPNAAADPRYERWIGKLDRNVFARLWWRLYVLGPEAAAGIGEDESHSIMERNFKGDRRVAKAIAEKHLRVVKGPLSMDRSAVLRDVMKRLLRLSYFMSIDLLSDSQLEELLDEVYRDSLRCLAPAKPPEVLPQVPSAGGGRWMMNRLRGRRGNSK